jgi:tetratricopeptide (TPR) repeat protein
MKNIFIATGIVAISIIISACSIAHVPINTPEINTRVKDERVAEMLLGHCSRACLMELPYREWYIKNYDDYIIDTITAQKLTPLLENKTIVVFLGTWCGDSRREVPRLIKLLDACKFPESALKLVMVDYRDGAYKQSPQHEERGKNIFRVPTILVYSTNKELGRIIEFPRISLEKDLLSIVNYENYIPNYPAGNAFLEKIRRAKVKELYRDSISIARQLQPGLRNSFELNSIGHMLLDEGEKEKALFVYQLNTDLYPSAVQSWNGLAHAYFALGRKRESEIAVSKALEIDPNNEEAKKIRSRLQ